MLRAVAEVLLVEDDPMIVRVFEINLRAATFEVRAASTGGAALEALGERLPDAIVCDLGLSDLSGAELLRAVADAAPGVPVVVVSGADTDAPGTGGYPSTVEAVLRKPVDPPEVVETVRRVLRLDV